MYLADEHKIWVCKGEDKICMLPKMANRHGLIAGATGTGKTVTLKVLAESFSEMGVPVFLADIKGDVSGMCKAGESSEGFQKRLHKLGIENFEFKGFPVRFFDVFGKKRASCPDDYFRDGAGSAESAFGVEYHAERYYDDHF